MKKLNGADIRDMMRTASNTESFELDLVGIESGVERITYPDREGDMAYRYRILDTLKGMYRNLHAADAAPAIIMEESLPAPAAQHYEDIKDRLDKLGEKVDQASSSLKDIIQAQFRPVATGVNLDELITSRGVSDPAIERGKHIHKLFHKRFPGTIGSVCDELKGMSQLDYFREQFMTHPLGFGKSNNEDVSRYVDVFVTAPKITDEQIKAEGERIHRAVEDVAKKAAEAKARRKALAPIAEKFIDMLFQGVDSKDLMSQIEADFGPGVMSIYHPSSDMILRSVRNLLVASAGKMALGEDGE